MHRCYLCLLQISLLCGVLSACPAQTSRLPAAAPVPPSASPPTAPARRVIPRPSALPPADTETSGPTAPAQPTPQPASSHAQVVLLPSGVLFASSGGSSAGASSGTPIKTPSGPQFQIQDVVLSATGASILGLSAAAAIQADYATNHPISITLRGRFDTVPVLSLQQMRLTHEPGLLHLSLLENELPARITLNHSMVLTPISVSATEIVAHLNSQGVPDLYLKGLHTLTLTVGQLVAESQIKLGDPLTPASLNPVIGQVEVLYDDHQHPVQLKLTGQHLMLQPGLNYVQLNGLAAQAYQTAVHQTETGLSGTLLVKLPDPETFDPQDTHELLLITPFGASLTSFSEAD